jgi:CBS-domain-containing membrane protein
MSTKHVSDIMNPKLLYIRDGDRLALTKAKILEFGVTAVPVLDEGHRPIGVVSLRDLLHAGEAQPSSPARVIEESLSIEEGAKALAQSGVHHLVVVDSRGVATGMVSAMDFLCALTGVPVQHPMAFAAF